MEFLAKALLILIKLVGRFSLHLMKIHLLISNSTGLTFTKYIMRIFFKIYSENIQPVEFNWDLYKGILELSTKWSKGTFKHYVTLNYTISLVPNEGIFTMSKSENHTPLPLPLQVLWYFWIYLTFLNIMEPSKTLIQKHSGQSRPLWHSIFHYPIISQ